MSKYTIISIMIENIKLEQVNISDEVTCTKSSSASYLITGNNYSLHPQTSFAVAVYYIRVNNYYAQSSRLEHYL